VTKTEINQLFEKLLSMYPTAKLTSKPETVAATWRSSSVLAALPWDRRGELYRQVVANCTHFPNLAELTSIVRTLLPKETGEQCWKCDGTGHLGYHDDETLIETVYVNKHGQTHTFDGVAVMYRFVIPCPLCNAQGRPTVAGGGA